MEEWLNIRYAISDEIEFKGFGEINEEGFGEGFMDIRIDLGYKKNIDNEIIEIINKFDLSNSITLQYYDD